MRRSRSRGIGGGAGNRGGYRPPPPRQAQSAPPAPPVPVVTAEQRQSSMEHEDFLYATIDFTPPHKLPPWEARVPQRYEPRDRTDTSVTIGVKLPLGWEVAPTSESLVEKVIKPFPWGTHLLVTAGGKAYQTAKGGTRPGGLEMIWDYDKALDRRHSLHHHVAGLAFWHGKILIRTPVPAPAPASE